MSKHDLQTYHAECLHEIVCTSCGIVHGYCCDLQVLTFKKENQKMINLNGNQTQQRNQNKKNRNGLPFLGAQDTSRTPQPAKVISARLEKDPYRVGMQVVSMRVEYHMQHWLLNLRFNNPNLLTLVTAWGEDESQWAGQEFSVYSEQDKHNDQIWLRVEPSRKSTSKK